MGSGSQPSGLLLAHTTGASFGPELFTETGSVTEVKKLATGTVKWFSNEKGYGFIVPDDGGKDLFVHHSNIDIDGFRSLEEGQQVEFEPAEGRKGPEATVVRPV